MYIEKNTRGFEAERVKLYLPEFFHTDKEKAEKDWQRIESILQHCCYHGLFMTKCRRRFGNDGCTDYRVYEFFDSEGYKNKLLNINEIYKENNQYQYEFLIVKDKAYIGEFETCKL